jgi:hypothetical protein
MPVTLILNIVKKLWEVTWVKCLVFFLVGALCALIFWQRDSAIITEKMKQQEITYNQTLTSETEKVRKELTEQFEKERSSQANDIRKVVVIKKPDGTVITTDTIDKTKKDTSKDTSKKTDTTQTDNVRIVVETKIVEKIVEKEKIITPILPRWSIEGAAECLFPSCLALETPTYRIGVGYRLLGNFWTTASYNPVLKNISLGLRIEF